MNFLEPGHTRCFPGSVRRFLFVAVLVLGVAWALPAAASAALTATQIRIGNHPAFVRVVVDFTGGTLHRNDVESPDPQPFDGRCARSRHRVGIRRCGSRHLGRVVDRPVVQRSGSSSFQLSTRSHSLQYLEHGVLHSPERSSVVDLWKARPPRPPRSSRRLRREAASASSQLAAFPGRVPTRATRTRERPLRAHVPGGRAQPEGPCRRDATRDRDRRALAQDGSLRHRGRAEGNRRGVDLSEQDGSLTCIAQLRATLAPAP